MSAFLAPIVNDGPFFIPGTNTPASGGLLFFYANKSTTKVTTYKDPAATTAWTNPIVLDSGGNLPLGNEVWFQTGQVMTAVFAPANDSDPPASPYWTKDDLSGMNDVTPTSSSEWQSGPTPTFVSPTSFSVVGDQRILFTPGRRLKTTNTAGTVYSEITSVTFGANTTVNVVNDSGALDAGLSAVFYGILDPAQPSISSVEIYRKGAAVVAASTTNIWGVFGDYAHITGTTSIGSFSTAPYAGAEKTLILDAATTLINSSSLSLPGLANITAQANDRLTVRADTASTAIVTQYQRASGAFLNMSTVINSLTTNVALNVTANYFDGPSTAQGTSGIWFASGTVTFSDGSTGAAFNAKLWDGTSVIAAGREDTSGAGQVASITLSGFITNPAANIKISVRDISSTTGNMLYNANGNGKDCTLSVLRIG